MFEAYYKDEGLNLGGVFVTLERSKLDGRILIEIDTAEAEGEDVFESSGVPKLRIFINDSKLELQEDGSLVVDGPGEPGYGDPQPVAE